MHQITINAGCHRMHYLFQDGAAPTLEAVVNDFNATSALGLGCSICDYGTESLEQPGLIAFYVEQRASESEPAMDTADALQTVIDMARRELANLAQYNPGSSLQRQTVAINMVEDLAVNQFGDD